MQPIRSRELQQIKDTYVSSTEMRKVLSPSLLTGTDKVKGTNAILKKIGSNLAKMFISQWARAQHWFYKGEWLTNDKVYLNLKTKISKVREAVKKGEGASFEILVLRSSAQEMKEICKFLRRSGTNLPKVKELEIELGNIENVELSGAEVRWKVGHKHKGDLSPAPFASFEMPAYKKKRAERGLSENLHLYDTFTPPTTKKTSEPIAKPEITSVLATKTKEALKIKKMLQDQIQSLEDIPGYLEIWKKVKDKSRLETLMQKKYEQEPLTDAVANDMNEFVEMLKASIGKIKGELRKQPGVRDVEQRIEEIEGLNNMLKNMPRDIQLGAAKATGIAAPKGKLTKNALQQDAFKKLKTAVALVVKNLGIEAELSEKIKALTGDEDKNLSLIAKEFAQKYDPKTIPPQHFKVIRAVTELKKALAAL
jgi:hypothetical protein